MLEFFDLKMAQIAPIFNSIFARIINKYLEWLENYTCPQANAPVAAQVINQVAEKNQFVASNASAISSGGIDIYAVLLCI